jgi:hypothetical protein
MNLADMRNLIAYRRNLADESLKPLLSVGRQTEPATNLGPDPRAW